MPEDSVAALAGLDLWIVDALRYQPHPSHFSVAEALAWIERIKPRRAILTNMHVDLDYAALRASAAARRSSPPMTGSPSRSGKGVEACKSHRTLCVRRHTIPLK